MLKFKRSEVGARFRCPDCDHVGKVLAPTVQDEQVDAAQEQIHTKRRQRKGWTKIRLGLLLMIGGWAPLTVFFVFFSLYLVYVFMGSVYGDPGLIDARVLGVIGIILFVADFATIAGNVLCLFGP